MAHAKIHELVNTRSIARINGLLEKYFNTRATKPIIPLLRMSVGTPLRVRVCTFIDCAIPYWYRVAKKPYV